MAEDVTSEEYRATKERLDTVLYLSIDAARMSAILLQPVVPVAAKKILDYLVVPEDKRSVTEATFLSEDEEVMGNVLDNAKSFVTFPKIQKQRRASAVRPPPQSATLLSAYLLKQSAGKWKRKRWNQRWFVLDREHGVLKYFRHASPLEAVPLRQDAHGVVALKQPGVALVVQGDLPRGVPTPFCFTVLADGQPQVRLCADTTAEFRLWTSAISAIISPPRTNSRGSGEAKSLPAQTLSSSSSSSVSPSPLPSPVLPSSSSTERTMQSDDDGTVTMPSKDDEILTLVTQVATSPAVEAPPKRVAFAGKVNGVKVAAGASVRMCEPAPMEIVAGCWTQIDATRFNVRQAYQPSNPLWGEKQGDGLGFSFVTYFAIPPAIRAMLDASVEPPLQSVRSERFKAIGIVVNPQEQRLGRAERHLLETYNGQPILTRPQHRFYKGDDYFEVDVDAHEFNYVARKGLVGVSEHACNMVLDFGFVLEGQEDHELPEQILGSVRLCQIDVRQAPRLS
ncbi:hypothetical protein BBJ28_00006251 [Nothophytophthora sp. Chile5]|nr:hypothetical protein BBJ28_00006251 [Nothophytophthora sp. Chile5]